MSNEQNLVTLADILRARKTIKSVVHRTPMMGSTYLSQRTRKDISLKLELFQKTGSFKTRGISYAMHSLTDDEKRNGVISLSAGNAAQAVAWAASQYNIPSTIIMPTDSVPAKQAATRGYGGEVLLTDGSLLDYCHQIQAERNLRLVHPFDDMNLIAGHGSLGVEILEDQPQLDAVFVGIGGGGLISGVAAAIKAKSPQTKVIGVEPEGAPTLTQSLQKGEPLSLERVSTVADGLAAPFAGQHTFRHVQALVDEVVTVSEEEILSALHVVWERCKVLAEPAACASVAALLNEKVDLTDGATVCCVISGGNVDLDNLAKLF